MLVQCVYGPTSTEVMGSTYNFVPDQYGRCVATVHDHRHVKVLTAVVHYRVVPDEPTELTLTSLEPNTAVLGSDDIVMRCIGTGFGPDSVISFAGADEPITFVSTEEITTGVKPSLGWGAVTLPVFVRRFDGAETDPLDFTFTEAVGVLETLPDDGEGEIPLTKINGIGKALAHKLSEQGITVEQIAKWSKKRVDAVDEELGLNGRIERDGWVEQAKALTG